MFFHAFIAFAHTILLLECAFSVGQTSHLSSLLCLSWLYLPLMAPVVVYVTACISLPLDCEFFAGQILLILRTISVLVQSRCLINICQRRFKKEHIQNQD